ncbi:HNH endonuclease [Ceratobasidium sp. AG-Ba]|nr:HNH endonuclease [Ceratobasidium sp. AG-Ba]
MTVFLSRSVELIPTERLCVTMEAQPTIQALIAQAKALLESSFPSTGDESQAAQILRSMIEFAPTTTGKRNICQEILKAESSNEQEPSKVLDKLGLYFRDVLFTPIKAQGGRTPTTSASMTRMESYEWQSAPNELDIHDPDFRAKVLERDGYMSVASGQIDQKSCKDGLVSLPAGATTKYTEVAHIIPFSLAARNQSAQRDRANVWMALNTFSGIDLIGELGGSNINRVGNAFTLTHDEHINFGLMHFWFEKQGDDQHTYILCGDEEARQVGIPVNQHITFSCHSGDHALPDPRSLAVHAACAQVIHASGIAEHIDNVIRRWEEEPHLASDGSSDLFVSILRHLESAVSGDEG